MNQSIVPRVGATGRRRLHAVITGLVLFALLVLAPGIAPAAAQTATPAAPQLPQQNTAPAAQNTPSASTSNSAATTDQLLPGGVIAHGLVYLDGSSQVWQVVQQKPAAVSSAVSGSGGPAFLFQRSGTTIVRNDVTGKRALLDASRAYYESAGDPYTTWADSSGSTLWSFQMVAPANVAKDAFYESPEMKGLTEGTYDLAMTRFILRPGDSVQLPDHTGPALVMAFAGKVSLTVSGSSGALSDGDGQLVTGNGSVSNQGNQTAGFVFVGFGAKISDQQPANNATKPATSGTSGTTPAANATVTSNAPAANANPTVISTAPAPQSTASATQAATGSGRTSIAVTAQADIYVEVDADGVVMFQGNLSTGQTTGQIAGSTFTVYTSSGVNTLFTNSCGTDFYMGNEQGEATYYLQAGPESCPPSV